MLMQIIEKRQQGDFGRSAPSPMVNSARHASTPGNGGKLVHLSSPTVRFRSICFRSIRTLSRMPGNGFRLRIDCSSEGAGHVTETITK
ncbi:MAG: hypothetical protein JWQ42_3962 [Edaphobacter sp.]|nr:hypothetical protein [Edaphobacter sp.]